VLYVNNIRNYYNIIRWLTGNEEIEEPLEEEDDTVVAAEEEKLIARLATH